MVSNESAPEREDGAWSFLTVCGPATHCPDDRDLPGPYPPPPAGTTSKGLGAHTDSGALERWLLPAYQVFARVFDGNVDKYDPWDAAHRTEVEEYTVDNTTKCSVFRTFQGWTALSDNDPGSGAAARGADPGGDGLCSAAPAARRCAGR